MALGDFRRLFDDHHDYVWCSLLRLGVHARDLEDLTHDVFLEVYAKRDKFDPKRPVRPWLFAFALRFASDYRKLARHKTELREAPDRPADGPSAEDSLVQKETADLLQTALEGLSMELRGVLVLHEIDEIPMREITEALGIPLQTGYSRLRLARTQCAEALRRLGEGGVR